jgi:hypothetical protein
MDPKLNEKITNFKELCVSLGNDNASAIVCNLLDNESLYGMFEELYLKLQVTQEQAYNELVQKLKFKDLTEDESYKVKRYIEYFFNVLELKYSNMSYEELLKQVK